MNNGVNIIPIANGHPLILIVDDDEDARDMMHQFLENEGYRVLEAGNGEQALQIFKNHPPALILMDAIMPIMDGFDACRKIRDIQGVEHVPIIMITAMEDDASIRRAFDAGAEEYITKPIQWIVIAQRIRLQISSHMAQANLALANGKMAFEREIVEEVLTKMRKSSPFDDFRLRYLLASVDKTAGDLILSARRPDGGQHILLGDVTGHGLPAAIIGPTVSDIFYSMTKKGFTSGVILAEINRKILEKLPTGLFLAITWVDLDAPRKNLFLWIGGMNDLLIFRQGEIIQRFQSQHMPLGIGDEQSFNMNGETITVQPSCYAPVYLAGNSIKYPTVFHARF
jgi:two-component system, HptB-dependent secretion and biofilm response regulator